MTELSTLLERRSDLWRGAQPLHRADGLATGFAALDAALAGGWPAGAVTELLSAGPGGGALELLAPALARLSAQRRWIALVQPPFAPYAPGLGATGIALERLLLVRNEQPGQALWALEQCLGSGNCSAALGWPGGLSGKALRRLQLAAAEGRCHGFLFRPVAAARESSPAALRLAVRRTAGGLEADILKRRGGWPQYQLRISQPESAEARPCAGQRPGAAEPPPRL